VLIVGFFLDDSLTAQDPYLVGGLSEEDLEETGGPLMVRVSLVLFLVYVLGH